MRPFAEGSMRNAYRMKDLTKGESDKEYVAKLSKDPRLSEKIIASVAPSICGHVDIKTSIALALSFSDAYALSQ